MTEEVLIELMSDPPPQGSLNLSPLGKTLVVALLNEEAYESDKAAKIHLKPVQSSSTMTAAYWYMPMVKLSPPESCELAVRGEKKPIDINIDSLLPDATDEQEVCYWIGCEKDEDLVNHFSPNAITDRMEPAQICKKNQHLGILTRLRLVSETYRDLISLLDKGWKWDGTAISKEDEAGKGIQDLAKHLESEYARLKEEELKETRKVLLKALESYVVTIKGTTIQLKDISSEEMVRAMGAESLSEQAVQQYGKLLELRRHYDRLTTCGDDFGGGGGGGGGGGAALPPPPGGRSVNTEMGSVPDTTSSGSKDNKPNRHGKDEKKEEPKEG